MPDDLPEYVIKPSSIRLFVSQLLITSGLAAVFYLGVYLNIMLLGISIPLTINILIVATLLLLAVIQALMTYLQTSKTRYSVYRNRIQVDGAKQEYIMFNAIPELKAHKNFLDNLFGTGSIIVGPKKKFMAIPNFNQNFNYINQLMQYSRTQYIQQ
jgi:hypothetical protein